MKIRSVTEIVKGLLKKADGEGRIDEMKSRIREHLARARDNGSDRAELDQFLYENEGQPRAIRAMNLCAKLDGIEARVSDATLIEQAVERRTPLSAAKIAALSEAFPFHACGDDGGVEAEVEDAIALEEDFDRTEAYFNGEIEDCDDPMLEGIDIETLAMAFSSYSRAVDDTPEAEFEAKVKEAE